jgi:hypothetical protein
LKYYVFLLFKDLNRVIEKPQVPPIEDENQPDYVNNYFSSSSSNNFHLS